MQTQVNSVHHNKVKQSKKTPTANNNKSRMLSATIYSSGHKLTFIRNYKLPTILYNRLYILVLLVRLCPKTQPTVLSS